MTKGELRNLIKEVLHEELGTTNKPALKESKVLTESVKGPGYVYRYKPNASLPWEGDTAKSGTIFKELEDLLNDIKKKHSAAARYDIMWVPADSQVDEIK